MPIALNREIRKILEVVVRKARDEAEGGSETALRQLGVADPKRPSWLSEADAALRVRLRAHAKTLGDPVDTGEPARMPRLIREMAYAHWHRTLFARFLLENGLLVDVEAGNAPVRPDELRAIAEQESRDVADVAAEFAGPMLPAIFPKDDPVLAVALPPETRQRLSELVEGLPAQTFKADDSLGWTYQFWQADRKKKVNDSEVKIGADELPAVTQLFTEDYMVLFLLENTLGAWWAGKKLAENPDLARDVADEDELRRKLSPPGYAWTYLRLVRDGDVWRPAAGAFTGWPTRAADITMLDPCMGSGHFLVFALDMLVALRKAEENLDDEAAVVAVLQDNLHGLEIDPRCTQIAAFALALAAWKRLAGVRPLPALHLACSGLSLGMGKEEFVRLAEKIAAAEGFAGGRADLLGRSRNPMEEQALARRRGGLEHLYDLFDQAPILGSLIDPRRALGDFGTLFSEGFDDLAAIIGKVLESADRDPEVREAAVTAQGLAKAAELLSRRFTLVATNVPYLGRRDMESELKVYVDKIHREAKGDLATCFIDRMRGLVVDDGSISCVAPQAWTYATSFEAFRLALLKSMRIPSIVRLGSGAFETISGEVVNVGLYIFVLAKPWEKIFAIDADRANSSERLTAMVKVENVITTKELLSSPSAIISFSNTRHAHFLGEYSGAFQGTSPGDGSRLLRMFWEVPQLGGTLEPFVNTPSATGDFKGREQVIFWHQVQAGFDGAAIRGRDAWNRSGIVTTKIAPFYSTRYTGELFSTSSPAIIPKRPDYANAIWCFMLSDEFLSQVQGVNSSFGIGNGYFNKIPFDLSHWQGVAAERYPNGLPKPYSNDPTQWLFDGHPRGLANSNTTYGEGQSLQFGLAAHPLQAAVARLLGYRWPRQTGSSFMDCPAIEEPDEIDRAGVIDEDGIVCLPALHGEGPAHERVRGVLKAAWGADWREGVESACLAAEGWDKDLESFLADGFFGGHCKLFHQMPFVWHIWDGIEGGFSALVNCHKLCAPDGEGRRLLEKLRDTYLGQWIGDQRRLVMSGDATAEDRLAAAEHLRNEFTAIIEGKPPYDIFVRWKALHQQPIGWEPDIDDGVRLNIRPFLTARPRGKAAKKACILRVTPGVKKHEGADRGGEPYRDKVDYPWFWAEDHDVEIVDFAGGSEFKGRRYNDFHYSRPFKQAARDRRKSTTSTESEAAE